MLPNVVSAGGERNIFTCLLHPLPPLPSPYYSSVEAKLVTNCHSRNARLRHGPHGMSSTDSVLLMRQSQKREQLRVPAVCITSVSTLMTEMTDYFGNLGFFWVG